MANRRDTFLGSTSTAVKTTNRISNAPPGTDGIDIEHAVTVIKIIAIDEKSNEIPFNRAIKMVEMARKNAVPLLFNVTPNDRTNFEIRSSALALFIKHCVATGSATALKFILKI